MLVIKGVNVYPSQLEAALLAVDDVAPHYQLLVDRTHEFPTLEVQVEPTEDVARRWGGFDADPAGGHGPGRARVRAAAGLSRHQSPD